MDDYDLPSIYKQTMGLAKTMVANNPKMSIDEAMAKAGKHLGKQNKWETQTRPGLEKTFGPLQPSTFNQNAVQRLRNTPEVVAQRKQRANEFLDQPTEPWQPPRAEIQAFERERIKDALGGFPDVEQSRFPRDVPPRASLAHVHAVYEDPENRELIKKQIRRGLPLGGETFYASLYPVKLAAMEAGIPPEKFDAWIHSIAPASARNSIMNEMAVGQAIRDAHAHGSDLSPESLAQVRAAFKAQHKTGLPMMPVHEEGVAKVLQNNLNLRDLSRANIPTNYKIPTYGAQKAGDFAHSWVGDVHEATGETLGSEHHPYFTQAGGFGNPEYGAAEQHMLDIAKELGIPGGTAQAGRWFGGGELTGLKSPRGDALDLLEKQVAYTLHHQGITPTPQEVRKYVLQMIGTGKGHLLPWYKKAGMPDLRVKNKKEGGEVCGCSACNGPSQDEMLAHVILHKAEGGAVDIKQVGAEEAPDMPVKEYVKPAGGQGLPIGGVDFQPEQPGQQFTLGAPNQPPGQIPGQPGQIPQQPAPLTGQPTPSLNGPQAPALNQPNKMLGGPPMPPFGQPRGPQSNILALTPQGQAMQALRPSPTPMPNKVLMPRMASGGAVRMAGGGASGVTSQKGPIGIDALGDSTTYGWNHGQQSANNMISTAQSLFGDKVKINNMGIPSTTLGDLLSSNAFKDVLTNNNPIVILNYGMNEAYRAADPTTVSGNDPESFRANLMSAVQQLQDAGKKVILQTPNKTNSTDGWQGNVGTYANIISDVANQTGAALNDKYNTPITYAEDDTIHPDEASYGVLGQSLYSTINSYLNPATQNASTSATDTTTVKPMSVEDLYYKVLGRAPDAEGLAYWKQQFGNEVDPSEASIFTGTAQNLVNQDPTTYASLAPNLTVQQMPQTATAALPVAINAGINTANSYAGGSPLDAISNNPNLNNLQQQSQVYQPPQNIAQQSVQPMQYADVAQIPEPDAAPSSLRMQSKFENPSLAYQPEQYMFAKGGSTTPSVNEMRKALAKKAKPRSTTHDIQIEERPL